MVNRHFRRLALGPAGFVGGRTGLATAVAAAALTLSACAGGAHWEHPETGQVNFAKDSAECRQLAATESRYGVAGRYRMAPLFPLHDRHHWYWFGGFDPFYDHDRFWYEADLRDFCLKSRGYRLVADTPGESAPDQ